MKSRSSKPASSPKKNAERKDVPARNDSFPVVAIGASAGGLGAFKEFFHALPSDTGKHNIDAVERSERYLQTIVEKVPTPLLVLDADLGVQLANEAFCETFQVSRGNTIGQMLYRLGNEQWNVPALSELLQTLLPQHKQVKNFAVTHDFPEIGWKTMLVSGRRIEEAFSRQGDPLILLTIEDITERKQAEIALARLAAIVEYSDDAIISKTLDGVIQTWNRGAEQLFGYTGKEAVGQPITMLMPSDRVHEEARFWHASAAGSTSITTNRFASTRMGACLMSP
jgi:PAS domain S-box-containing protein